MGTCCSADAEKKQVPARDTQPHPKAAGQNGQNGVNGNGHSAAATTATTNGTHATDTPGDLSGSAQSEVKVVELDQSPTGSAGQKEQKVEDLPPLVVDEKVTAANTERWASVQSVIQSENTKLSTDAAATIESQAESLGLTAPEKTDDETVTTFFTALDKRVEQTKAEPDVIAAHEQHWEKVFRGYDINGDGVLDIREHRLMYTDSLKQQRENAPEFVKSHYATLSKMILEHQMKFVRTEDGKRKLHETVKRFDTLIPIITEKVIAALTANLEHANARADKVFRAMDTNNDGKVTLQDLKHLYRNSPVMGQELSYYVMDAIEKTPFPGNRL